MTNRAIVGVLVSMALLAACRPTPPSPPPMREARAFAVLVEDAATRQPIAGAAVQVCASRGETRHDGYGPVTVEVPSTCLVRVERAGYDPFETSLALTQSTPDLPVRLTAQLPPRPDRAAVLRYRGLLANIRDGSGRIIWTPALPGAPAATARDWLDRLAAAGATHVPIGPFDAGPVYPGVEWGNPDWTRDVAAIRALLLAILETRTLAGHGMVPVVFLDNGGRDPNPRLAVIRPTLSAALEGIGPHSITVPCGWESYEWRARECADSVAAWAPLAQGSVLAWHGWQDRSNGASNPGQDDDVWLGPVQADGKRYGQWDLFWGRTPFEMFLYQSRPIRTLAEARCGKTTQTINGKTGLAYPESCWKNRFQDAVARVGAGRCTDDFGDGGPCGPGRRVFVAFEQTAYFEFRDQMESPDVSRVVATEARALCQQYGVDCGFGNGLPQ